MEFKYEKHNRTKRALLLSDEELIETLEENQVCWLFHFRFMSISEYITMFPFFFNQGPTSKSYDLEIYRLLSRASVRLAEKIVHCRFRDIHLVWGTAYLVLSGGHFHWFRRHPFPASGGFKAIWRDWFWFHGTDIIANNEVVYSITSTLHVQFSSPIFTTLTAKVRLPWNVIHIKERI